MLMQNIIENENDESKDWPVCSWGSCRKERTDLWRQQKEKGHEVLWDFFLCYTSDNTVLVISVTAPQSNSLTTTSLPFYSKPFTGNKQTNKQKPTKVKKNIWVMSYYKNALYNRITVESLYN